MIAEVDKDSENWDRIKNFMGGRNKPSKHPLEQELERREAREPEHFDEGGMAGDIPLDFDPNKPADAPRGTIPGVPAAPVIPPVAPNPVSVPAGVPSTPMDASMDKQATDVMGGVTPETINRLMESLNHQNRVGQIGAGIAGIGDAISSVGGVKGEHMKNAEDMLQKNRDVAMKIPGEMAAIGKEKYGLSKELGGDEPGSVRSFTAQNANMPLLSKMGMTPEQIRLMPASLIDGIRSGAISAEEAKLKVKELEIQGQRADTAEKQMTGELKHQTAEEENARAQREQESQRLGEEARANKAREAEAAKAKPLEAAKELQGRPWYQKGIEAIPSFGLTTSESTKKLREAMNPKEQSFSAPGIGQTVVHPSGAKVTRHR
jgi:hypothetical protein